MVNWRNPVIIFWYDLFLPLFLYSKDATIILFDVGSNTTEHDQSKSQTFYEQAKNCVEAILLRKVMGKIYYSPYIYYIPTIF